jgi:L-fucose isomerase-like protein
MYLPLGKYSPDITLGLVSASRNCFPRSLSEERTARLVKAAAAAGIKLVTPQGESAIVETKAHALEAATQLKAAGVDAVVFYLGNFSPEIEDAVFIKEFGGYAMILAAAEEDAGTLLQKRGDALCGLLSAVLAVRKRDLLGKLHIPEAPVVSAEEGVAEIQHFIKVMKVVKGAKNATLGLFGPRPRDFESCNYNTASVSSIGIEIEELGLFDLENEVQKIKAEGGAKEIAKEMKSFVPGVPNDSDFVSRLSDYEKALLNFRERLQLSGAASQCWSEQETALKHVPCFINGRLADKGFPVACENDTYSLVSELLGQYASDKTVTILDINHSIPKNLHASLKDYPVQDMVGMFHCGNTARSLLKNPEMKHQVIMKRLMEPNTPPDITRGTVEGQIIGSPITVVQVHGVGDKLRAYIAEGEFLDLDPKTFGSTGTAYIPGFRRFYRHVLLGRFHHHAAVAFNHCGAALYDAFKMLGVEEIYTPLPDGIAYPGENVFRNGLTATGKK